MDPATISLVANELRRLAQMLDKEAVTPMPIPVPKGQVGPGNMFDQPVKPGEEIARWDPRHPEYTPDKGWQIMLRRYARDAGLTDNNTYVKEKHARGECGAPAYPDAKQSWEP